MQTSCDVVIAMILMKEYYVISFSNISNLKKFFRENVCNDDQRWQKFQLFRPLTTARKNFEELFCGEQNKQYNMDNIQTFFRYVASKIGNGS